MGLFDTIARRFGYAKTRQVANLAPWQAHYASGESYNLPDPSVYGNQADYYRKLSWIGSAVQILAQSCATVDFEVTEVRGEEESQLINHDFERLLYNPNPLESRFEFLENWFSYRILTGNGYAWLNRAGPDEPPAEIWSLPSNMVIPVPDEKMFLRGYKFLPGDGAEIPLEPWEIVHLKRFNPANKFIGLSPVEAIALSAEQDMARMRQETKTYGKNNGRLPAILTFPEPIPNDEWQRMQEEIDDKANQMRNYLMLRNTKSGVGVIQAAMNQRDAQFIESRAFTKEEIYALFAPGLASMLAINATEANSKSGKGTFNDYALWPLLVSAAEKITNDVLPAYGPNLRGQFVDVRVKDMAMVLQEIAFYSQTHTIKEVRRRYYRDEPLGDERDNLFTTQVTPPPAPVAPPAAEPVTTSPEQPAPPQQPEGLIPGAQLPPESTQWPWGRDEQELDTHTSLPAMSQKAWKELEIWHTKAVKMFKSGQSAAVDFRADFIRPSLAGSIAGSLQSVRNLDDIKAVFVNAAEWRAYP